MPGRWLFLISARKLVILTGFYWFPFWSRKIWIEQANQREIRCSQSDAAEDSLLENYAVLTGRKHDCLILNTKALRSFETSVSIKQLTWLNISEDLNFNRLTPNDPYMGRTAPLTSKRCILYTEWPKKMYTLFPHQYLWNKFKWNFYFRVRV